MGMISEAAYYYWLCNLKEVWTVTRHKLLSEYGCIEALYEAKAADLRRHPYLTEPMITVLTDSGIKDALPDRFGHFLESEYHFTWPRASDYPEKLLQLSDYPLGLFYKGKLPDPDKKSVAIVGARACSIAGRARAASLAEELSGYGVQIISGMAVGIDGYAHQGALEGGGDTFAILGSGVDRCYPRDNWHIYRSLALRGGCISEFAMGDAPLNWHFPMRNRLISCFSELVVIVEARENSGSILTAGCALDQGRDVFVVPGRPEDVLTRGCLNLIEEGAGVLADTDILLQSLGIDSKPHKKSKIQLDKFENMVYATMCSLPKSAEALSSELDLDLQQVCFILYKLENMGLVRQIHRNSYIRRK